MKFYSCFYIYSANKYNLLAVLPRAGLIYSMFKKISTCLFYFAMTMTRHHDQDNLWKKAIN